MLYIPNIYILDMLTILKMISKIILNTKKQGDKMEKIKQVFKWEGISFDYFNQQIEGLVLEISKPQEYQHIGYIEEKIENIKNSFNSTIDNFKGRITATESPAIKEELQKDFLKLVEDTQNL